MALCCVQVTASGEVTIFPSAPIAANNPSLPTVTPLRSVVMPENCVDQFAPSGEVKIFPPYPTAANNPGLFAAMPYRLVELAENGGRKVQFMPSGEVKTNPLVVPLPTAPTATNNPALLTATAFNSFITVRGVNA